jgi:hypothetical protein
VRVVDTYEASPLQAGMLFHAAAATHSGADIEQVIATLREPLYEGAFLRAWERLLERHAILRTRFRWQGLAQPVQEVVDRVRIPVQWFDWRALAEPGRRARLEILVEEHRVRGFDTTQAPLMRLALVRAAEAEHTMVWTFHHLLLDGRARLLLLQELFARYEGFTAGREIETATPRPYRDYIEWLRGLDLRAPTPLAVAGSPQHLYGRGYAVQECRLSAALSSALRKRARAARITLEVLLQGAWALLLHRYSGEADVVFGVTHACRPSALAGAAGMVGLLINILPWRVAIDPQTELLPWLQSLREPQLGLREFERTPPFETLFAFHPGTLDAQLRAQGGAWSSRRFLNLSQTNYPLTVAAYGDEELLLQLQYSRRRFADKVVQRMSVHLQALLEGMAADPRVRLRHLPLVTAAKHHQPVPA